MKRIICYLLVFLMAIMPIQAFASYETEMQGHWSNAYIEKAFVDKYFPMYKENDYKNMKLNAYIRNDYFYETLIKVVKDNVDAYTARKTNLDIRTTTKRLTRQEAVDYVTQVLKGYGRELPTPLILPQFRDLGGLTDIQIENIAKVYKANIMQGYDKNNFRPDGGLTLAQGIIILERVGGYLNEKEISKTMEKEIPFKVTKGSEPTEGVRVEVRDEKIYIYITKEFPTAGYGISVKRVARATTGDYWIYLQVKSPKITDMVAEVRTRDTVVIEISKWKLSGKTYQFKLDWSKDSKS